MSLSSRKTHTKIHKMSFALYSFCLIGCIARIYSQYDNVCRPTSPDILGPYYIPHQPRLPMGRMCLGGMTSSNQLHVTGHVYSNDCTTPLSGVEVEVWQANSSGLYGGSGQCRGKVVTSPNGHYSFWTVLPGKYAIDIRYSLYRPAHIHFLVRKAGYKTLVTQMYFNGDSNLGLQDPCRVCSSEEDGLMVELETRCWPYFQTSCYKKANFDIILTPGTGMLQV